MASSILSPGLIYLWLMQRKKQLASRPATGSQPIGSAMMDSESAGTSQSTSRNTDSPVASATLAAASQTSPEGSSISEPNPPGTFMTASTQIATPMTASQIQAVRSRSTFRHGHGGR